MQEKTVTLTKKQMIFTDWAVDIFLYVIILNFFVEHVSGIYIDSFTISFFTAIVLKILIFVLSKFEHKIQAFFNKMGKKTLGTITVLIVLFLSKFLILEIIDWIFGDEVTIKGFIPLAAMIVTMIVARKLLNKFYKSL